MQRVQELKKHINTKFMWIQPLNNHNILLHTVYFTQEHFLTTNATNIVFS